MLSPNRIAGILNQQIDEIASIFLQVDTNSQKLKVDQKCFGWVWSKMGLANLVSGL